MPTNNTTLYRVVTPLSELPPREVRVTSINSNPFNLDFAGALQELAFDIEISNDDAVTATVVLNSNPAYSLTAGAKKQHSDIQITGVTITGITNGLIISHVLPIALLTRQKAIEVR